MLRRDRLPNIRKFVSQPDAILPTNIVLALSDSVTVQVLKQKKFSDEQGQPVILSKSDFRLVGLSIPMEYASLELLDGQHRLFGFASPRRDQYLRWFRRSMGRTESFPPAAPSRVSRRIPEFPSDSTPPCRARIIDTNVALKETKRGMNLSCAISVSLRHLG